MILSYVLRDWFSGRMTAFQAVEKGSIPLSRTKIKVDADNKYILKPR